MQGARCRVQGVGCLFEGHRLERKKHAVGALLAMLGHSQDVQLRVKLLQTWLSYRANLERIRQSRPEQIR